VIGHYFFEDESGSAVAVSFDPYVRMVSEFLLAALRRRENGLCHLLVPKRWKAAHAARPSMSTLRTVLEHRILPRYGDISRPARSADLLACNLFSWGSKIQMRPIGHVASPSGKCFEPSASILVDDI
jgi:hypothetical protein